MKGHGPPYNEQVNVDLHCHSTISDGTLTPETLAQRAQANGVELWALTDHDELGGVARAQEAALDLGMHFLTGVEISASYGANTLHIVGLGVDPTHPDLCAGMTSIRTGRERRARLMSESLAQAGITGAFEGALKYAGNPNLISRTHFARHLVKTGVCRDPNEVFRRYLTPGKPGFVPHQWATLADAVTWIRRAGGMAILAHPGRYPLTANQEYALLSEFKTLGGLGIEVITGSHSPAEFIQYAQVARETGLAASCGSDFHAPGESRIDLGDLPAMPDDLPKVWDLLADRIHHPRLAG